MNGCLHQEVRYATIRASGQDELARSRPTLDATVLPTCAINYPAGIQPSQAPPTCRCPVRGSSESPDTRRVFTVAAIFCARRSRAPAPHRRRDAASALSQPHSQQPVCRSRRGAELARCEGRLRPGFLHVMRSRSGFARHCTDHERKSHSHHANTRGGYGETPRASTIAGGSGETGACAAQAGSACLEGGTDCTRLGKANRGPGTC